MTPVLLFIRRHCEMGLNDPLWFEEQFAFLLERMLARHRDVLQRARGVPVRRAATRREILRRVSLATDFIHSNFDKPLMLGDMAQRRVPVAPSLPATVQAHPRRDAARVLAA